MPIPSQDHIEERAPSDEPCQLEGGAKKRGEDKGDSDDAREFREEPCALRSFLIEQRLQDGRDR